MLYLDGWSCLSLVIWREKMLFLETTYPYLSNNSMEYIPFQASFFHQLYISYLNSKYNMQFDWLTQDM
jgi:hypothetical protein